MSSRQQEPTAARHATKLPQFPARRSTTTVGKSPLRRSRVDALPGVPPAARSPAGRLDPSQSVRTGAEKLQQLGKRKDADSNKYDSFDDEAGGVDGFESPQLAKARAQVARDEVLSYMHHRRYQRKDTGKRAIAHTTEPRDDDSDFDDDRTIGTATKSQPTPDSAGDPSKLLQRVQQALDRWPPGRRTTQQQQHDHHHHHHSFPDDDLRPTSADQSPTRHGRSYLESSGASLVPVKSVVGTDEGAGRDMVIVHRPSCAGQGHEERSLVARAGAGDIVKAPEAYLSEGAFYAFKRELAARVIQTHWRRWQGWKAKVRREAEERILQQLLADDSGLSLRLLLGPSPSSGNSKGAVGEVADGAPSRERMTAESMPPQSTHARALTSAIVPTSHTHALHQPAGRSLQPGRPASGSSGGGGGGGGPQSRPGTVGNVTDAAARVPVVRPASAAAAPALARGRSPARTAPATVPGAASPGRGGRPGPGGPAACREGCAGQGPSFDSDKSAEDFVRGACRPSEDSVRPWRRHVGGHAVYTFVATPQKQASIAAAPPDAFPAAATQPDRAGARFTTAEASMPPRGLPEDHHEAKTAPSSYVTTSRDDDDDAAAAPQQDPRPTSSGPKAGPRPPSPPPPRHHHQQQQQQQHEQQQQPSLDADTNPAMASPTLSAATAQSIGDSVVGLGASPLTPMAGPSATRGAPQPATAAAAFKQSDLVSQPQLKDPRPQDGETRFEDRSRCNARPQQPHQQQDQQQQLQQRPRSGASVSELASPPLSPVSGPRPPPLQPDLSPSPQHRARMQALQRLKLQGSMRGTLKPSSAAAPVPAPAIALAPPSQPHPPSVAEAEERQGQGRHFLDSQPERQRELGVAVPSGELQQPRTRRQVWLQAEEGLEEPCRQESRKGYREQGGSSNSGREHQHQQHPHLQPQKLVHVDVGGDGDVRGRQLRQQPSALSAGAAAKRPELRPELSEEASLRSMREMPSSSHQKWPSALSPFCEPRIQDATVMTSPRSWNCGNGRLATAPPPRGAHTEQPQPPTRHADCSVQPWEHGKGGYIDGADPAAPVNPDCRPVCRGTSQHVPQLRPSGAGRPFSAADADDTRLRGASGVQAAPAPRSSYAGDEGSLEQLAVHSQKRLLQHAVQGPTGREDAVAWPEEPVQAGAGGPAERGMEQMVMQGRGTPASVWGDAAGGAAKDAEGATLGNAGDGGKARGGMSSSSSSGGASGGGGSGKVGRGAVSCGGGSSGAGDEDPRVAVDTSATAQKMSSILKYLEEVELQAEQEATCAALAPALLATEPSAAAAVAAALLPGGIAYTTLHTQHHSGCSDGISARSGRGSGGGHVRLYGYSSGTATANGTRQVTNSSRPGTAHTMGSLMSQQQAALSEACTAARQSRHQHHQQQQHHHGRRPRSQRRGTRSLAGDNGSETGEDIGGEEYDVSDNDGDGDDDDGVSVATRTTVAGMANRSAFLAESVYENVRAKIRRLEDDIKQRDARINELSQDVESLQAAQRTCLLDADARLTEMLAAQRAEYEAAVSRHMAFVDRLLADKEALSSRAQQLAEQVKSVDERQERAIAKLKEGWAAELKRQKESWAAAEKQRREAWMQSKATEIKDMTVKGLEGEVQKLLARHRAELSAAQQAAAEEAKRHLDAYVAQNEVAVRQLKERMSREAEEAVEKERASAATRLREVSERYEQQLQTQRMRLVADADLRLEQLEQARKEDKKRYEEAIAAAKEAGEARLKEAEEDWKREKEAVRKAHEKQIDALREQYETGQEGWRAAMAERARKEVSERVAAIREKLLQERNEEVQAVMTRLEAEHASTVEALKEDFRRREEAAAARAASSLKEARRAEAKMAERFRNAGVATKAAEERLAASELTISDLRRELETRNNTIRWLESQVSSAKDEAVARERDVRSLGDEKAAVAAEVAAAVARDKQQVEARLAQAQQENQELRNRHAAEMAAVEARVRATLARKEEVISGLREQAAAMAAELRDTQEVLRQQQEEFGSDLDGGASAAAAIVPVVAAGRSMYSEASAGAGARRGGRH